MKSELYDYSGLSLRTLHEKRFRHLLLLASWILYVALYMLTENCIPYEKCTPVHCALDDLIPFCEYWAFFYCLWYFLILFSVLYFLRTDVKSFTRMQIFIIITQIIGIICYVLYPTRQDMRPASFERDNVFTRIMALLYSLDTPTGVCPSLHVAYTCAVVSTYFHKKDFPAWVKALSVVLFLCISLSTLFVKQHSFIDVIFGILTGLIAEMLTNLLLGKYLKSTFAE